MSPTRIGLALSLSALLLGSPSTSLGQEQSASPLQDIGELLVGHWTGEGVYAADYPGIGKKGEKFTVTYTCGWAAGEAAILCEGENNTEATWTGLYWWDAAAMEIKTTFVNSGGNWARGTISKQGTKLVWASAGSFSDGRKVEYKSESTFEDDGNTRIETGATILDGVANEWRDTFRRAAK